ncbi:MAG: thymidine phosphorylase [Anaerolineaceae bacterium]|nr:thymidine phosphorylase [Anaerolineaceae bacterium]
MRAVDIITKKRDKQVITTEEIQFFVKGFTDGTIPDYQLAAWAMAVLLNGMNAEETTALTLAMAASGELLDLSDAASFVVDKHSTGGVGDKTTLVVAPLVASCGLPVGKMSGRGLGFSGGTIDKLEAIQGYRTDLSKMEFLKQLKEYGIVLTGQSADLAPADGKLYALRDVTGTVQSLPLIASSIMSKKIAAGANAIVLDVKTGVGAFMETLEEAKALSHMMVDIGHLSGRKTVALLSDMNQPLGQAVGNALELIEAIKTLKGEGPHDFLEHCLVVASHMLVLGKKVESLEEGRALAEQKLSNGEAFKMLEKLVEIQGGNVDYLENISLIPSSELVETVASPQSGYIHAIHAGEIGMTAVDLGAGRAQKGDEIDLGVGLEILHNVGDEITEGEPLFRIHGNTAHDIDQASKRALAAHDIRKEFCEPLPLFYGVIE